MSSLPPPPPRPVADAHRPPPPPPPPGGGPWAGPDPWSALPPLPPARTLPQRPRWLAPLGGAISAVLLAGVVSAVARSIDRSPTHPDRWDPRVADLAAFVERERGRDFEHPVHVDFLTADEYTDAVTATDDVSEEQEREDLEIYESELRALGVASGEIDLYEAFTAVVDSGTLAFYDPQDQRVRVRGTEMSVGMEVTIVHELTHALHDQHFGFDVLDDPTIDSGAAVAYRSLTEGDALRVENAYIEKELTDAERDDYDEEFADALAASEAGTTDVPPFLEATFGAPYALGQPFITMLFNRDGNDGVDEAFEDPPSTEEHVFDPTSFLDGDGASRVGVDLPSGAERVEDGRFGAIAWYLVLAERIDPKVAFEAALGWDGDQYALYEHDGDLCIQAVFEGASGDDNEQMDEALRQWRDATPGDHAQVVRVNGHPGLDSCDPGPDIDLELTGRSETSLYLPNLWGYLVADGAVVLDPEGCRCYARTVVDELTYEQITDSDPSFFEGDAFQGLLERAFAACE